MSDAVQLVVAGLSVGAVYSLVAIGLVCVFTVSGVINLAQGDLAVLAAFVAIAVADRGGWTVVAVTCGVMVSAVVSLTIERVAIQPLGQISTLNSIIVTVGVSTALRALMLLWWGPSSRALSPLPGSDVTVLGVSIRAQQLWIIGTLAVVATLVASFYAAAPLGKALRACAEQRTAARLVGISPLRATMVAFLVAGVVSAFAGIVSSPVTLTSWDMGLSLGLKGFVAAALAGLASIRGAVAGGLLLGVLESLVAGYVDSGLRDAVAFLVLIALLLVRPAGVFGGHRAVRV
jgi:branched-chain amino acid transport system permease protein